MSIDFIPPDLDGEGLRIGLVQARFNDYAGQALAAACIEELLNLGVDEDDITHVTVPGALEVPLALTKLAATQDFDALIAVGAVVRGDTYHFEVVSNESAAGISRVALDTGVPVANAILTCDTDEQVRARMTDKGRDAARVAVEMANLLWALEEAGDEELDTAGGAPARDDD
ncbi:MAG: 6,7-dimethyl-8-ribityllumazine synthase [Burkholderiaceae bacterium]|jgi:6,7-dimethyl-8-ribityllumazine synthase|nr:6,7-dimethyl-8-ribityllumazine synthase [Burkholderiaceae bacterium]